jgi:hypothetical protein
MNQSELPEILQEFEKLRQRNKPLYKASFDLMKATTQALKVSNPLIARSK